jgi:hypothetical protein
MRRNDCVFTIALAGFWLASAIAAEPQPAAKPAVPSPEALKIMASLPPPDPASISFTLLPDAEQRNLVVKTCLVCHPVELVVSQKRTIEAWDKLIGKMVDYGAKADDDQQIEILTYFATHFVATIPTAP